MSKQIVMLGHKDHGKSTFLGRLLFETSSVPEDKVQTIREIDAEAKKPFEWAHLLDSFKEEREEEMTYDTAAAFIKGKKDVYNFIDVPGHVELVHQMLSGASRAGAAILIVSAKEGVDIMTVKHAALAGLLGIKELIVAVNKMDAVGYKEQIFLELNEAVARALSGIGFDPKNAVYFPVSAANGDNITHKSPKMPWFSGLPIFEYVERLEFRNDLRTLPLRLLLQDVYADGEAGGEKEMIVGNVKSGFLKSGKELVAMPAGEPVRIAKLFSSSGEELKEAVPGENVSMIFVQNGSGRPKAGYVLSYADDRPELAKSPKTKNFFFRNIKAASVLELECGKMSSELEIARDIKSGEIMELRLSLAAPVLFDSRPTFLNKFVFKSGGEIVGVGVVESL